LFTREELNKKSIAELDLLFEEMKARQGFIFDDPALQQHFSKQAWYNPIQSNRPMMEINDLLEEQFPIIDEDNRHLIATIIHEKTLAEVLASNPYYKQIHVKTFPMINFDIAAAKLTPVQGDLEALALTSAQNVANRLLFENKIPTMYGPTNLEEISMKDPWQWFRPHTAAFLIYFSFVEDVGDGIKIYHADNPQSIAAAKSLVETFNYFIALEKNVYPWPIKLAGNHEILNHNNDGVSLLIHVIAPEDMTEFEQFHVAGKMLEDSVIELVMVDFKKNFGNKK
jgi:hypothetical protein